MLVRLWLCMSHLYMSYIMVALMRRLLYAVFVCKLNKRWDFISTYYNVQVDIINFTINPQKHPLQVRDYFHNAYPNISKLHV